MTKKRINLILLNLLFLLAFSPYLFAQSDVLRETFLEAESWFLFEEYPDALDLYMQIHDASPENDNINYKIGICYLNDPYQREKAIPYLVKASKNINPKYKENSFKETTAPPEVLYFLGNAYLANYKIDSAKQSYEKFLGILDEEIYDKELVEFQITCCETATELIRKPVDFDIRNLDSLINTRYAEKNAVVSGDGQSMVFVYEGPFQDAPFYTTMENGVWRYPRNLNLELGVDGDVYPTALSHDGSEMFIYRNDDYTGNLYHSRLVDGKWIPLEKLNDNINTKYWESHASLSRDGKTLFFTSNRKGGHGGLDIYTSELKDNGEWGPAVNLGPEVNSKYNEDTPFVTGNNQVLYYCSEGHYNMGGYDIFYVKKESDSLWSHSINMGYPINSTSDDRFFYPVNNGFGGYYSLFMPGGLGRHDIYYMDIYSDANPRIYLVSGRVRIDDEQSDSAKVIIYLVDTDTGDTISTSYPEGENGTFDFKLTQGLYSLIIAADNYEEVIRPLHITPGSNKDGVVLPDDINLKLKPHQTQIFLGDDSNIEIKDSLYVGVAGEPLNIPLRLEKGSVLISTITVDSVIVSSDTILVDKRRMELEVIPLPGTNTIDLQMITKNGDIHKRTVIVEVEKPEFADELLPGEISTIDSRVEEEEVIVTDTYKGVADALPALIAVSSGGLKAALMDINPEEQGIRNERELFQHLYDNADEENYSRADVDILAAEYIANGDINRLHQILLENSEGALKVFLENLSSDELKFESIEEYMTFLKENAAEAGYKDEDIRNALLKGLEKQTEVERIFEALLEKADGELLKILEETDLSTESIYSIPELISYLVEKMAAAGLSPEEIRNQLLELFGNNYLPLIEISLNAMKGKPAAILVGGALGLIIIFLIIVWRRRRDNKPGP